MQKLSKSGASQADQTSILAKDQPLDVKALPANSISTHSCLVHVGQFLANAEALLAIRSIGVWLDADDDARTLKPYSQKLAVIGVSFPVFMDGRGFSHARILKSDCGFTGELLAIGDYMQDQLFYLKRCGFDAFLVPDDVNVESMKISLHDFQSAYQASADDPRPIYRKREFRR